MKNPFKLIIACYYSIKIVNLNQNYKNVVRYENDKRIKELRMYDIDKQATLYENKLRKLYK